VAQNLETKGGDLACGWECSLGFLTRPVAGAAPGQVQLVWAAMVLVPCSNSYNDIAQLMLFFLFLQLT
jgi:hypothetical protein